MKRFYFFLVLLSLCIECTYAYNTEIFKFKEYSVKNGKGMTIFTYYSEKDFNCDITFLALPAEYSRGQYSNYSIICNDNSIKYNIHFDNYGWQRFQTHNNSLNIKKRVNVLKFISNNKELPQIRQVEVFDNCKHYEELCYNSIAPIKSSKAITNDSLTRNMMEKPMYRLGVDKDKIFFSTFILSIYFEKGERASFYAPTKADPAFGLYESNIEFNLYFFYENPELFSISESSHNKYIFQRTDSLPETGIYYVLVEAQSTGETGFVTLFINNNMLYKHNFVSNSECNVLKDHPNGMIYVDDKHAPYNMFTINSRSSSLERVSNPCLWLKKAVGDKYKIVAYNDDNNIDSDFNWGYNARIRTTLEDGINYKLLITSSNPYNMIGDTCDVYHSFWSTPTMLFNTINNFINLKQEDLIESDVSTNEYNCISWSAGVNFTWLNPETKDLNWFDKLYNNEIVYDGFSQFKRPDSFPKYTRKGANESNSVLYLWGDIINGDTIVKHASIKNTIDDNPHGYDWESKFGNLARAFHPRLSLQNSSYGRIIACYRKTDNNFNDKFSPQISLIKAIDNGELKIETIDISTEEKDIIDEKISSIDFIKLTEIESYYKKWSDYYSNRKHESIIGDYSRNNEYNNLLRIINKTKNSEFFVFNKFLDGDISMIRLIKDFAYASQYTKELWDNITKQKITNNIIRNYKSNIILFIKSIINNQNDIEQYNSTLSNENEFDILVKSYSIVINIENTSSTECEITLYDINNNNIKKLLPKRILTKGAHKFEYNVSQGLYIVSYINNGNINTKKIIVK